MHSGSPCKQCSAIPVTTPARSTHRYYFTSACWWPPVSTISDNLRCPSWPKTKLQNMAFGTSLSVSTLTNTLWSRLNASYTWVRKSRPQGTQQVTLTGASELHPPTWGNLITSGATVGSVWLLSCEYTTVASYLCYCTQRRHGRH